METFKFFAIFAPIILVLTGLAWVVAGSPDKPMQVIASSIGLASLPDKPGWMDDAPLSTSDITRIAALKGMGSGSDGMHLLYGGIGRRDFELLRQDRRRARAAHPDIDPDKLFSGAWMPVSEDAKVPSDWCTSHNSHGTMGKDGKWYLDGGCYMSVARPEYTERASAADTTSFFAALKLRDREKKLARLRENGPFTAWGGTGGSMSVRLDKDSANVVIERAQEWARTAKRWTMPFVADEWADINASDLAAIKKIPSFAAAKEEEIEVTPSGVTITMGSMGSPQGVLMPGESTSISVPVTMR